MASWIAGQRSGIGTANVAGTGRGHSHSRVHRLRLQASDQDAQAENGTQDCNGQNCAFHFSSQFKKINYLLTSGGIS